jgi:4-aminobutyrate aminotransferase/(S)-3-amino-2-methylpropionate transaminase
MKVATKHIRIQTEIPGPESRKWMARRESSVPRGVFHYTPVFVASGTGATLVDVDGNRLLDFAGGIGCINVGHVPEHVQRAVQEQSAKLIHGCFSVTPYSAYIRLAEELNKRTPGHFPKKTVFVNSGAEAVENAVKIARCFTGRPGILCFEHAFHGRTLLAMSLTSKTSPYKLGFGPFAPEIYRIPYAYCYRCSYSLTFPECNLHCARQVEETFRKVVSDTSLAAVIFEPVLGEGGFVAPPRDFFQIVADICRERGILLIADEIQCGYGRTGTLFACEQFGIAPDLLIAGKSIAAGLPLASVTGRAEIMDAPGVGGLGGTYGGNPVACEAALAVLEELQAQDLSARAEHLGSLFSRHTSDWMERFPLIGEIRGMGAMRAIELVRDRVTREPARTETEAVLADALKRGLVCLSAGTYGNVLRLLVPLIISDEQFEEGLSVLEASLSEVCERASAIARGSGTHSS